MIRLVLVVCLVATAAAQDPAAATELVTAAETALARDDEEGAAEVLLRAETACGELAPSVARTRLFARLKAVRARVGGTLDLVQAAERDAARALVKAAEVYAGRTWHHTAADLLEEARRLEPTVAAQTRRPPRPDARLIGVGNQLQRFFAPGEVELPYGGKPWLLDPVLVSPALTNRESIALFSRKAVRQEYEITARIALPATACKIALVFGYQEAAHTYYLLELAQGPRRSDLRLYAYQGQNLQPLGATTLSTAALRQLGGELAIAVTGAGIRAAAGGATFEVAKAALPLTTDGGIGFLISGDTPYADSITIEGVRLEQR